jgi:putative flippase GtrA
VKRPTLTREVVGFLVIGIIGTVIHVSVGLSVNSLLKVSPLTANVIGYTSAFTFSYFGNSAATFGRSARDLPQFVRFMTVSLAMFGLNEAIVFAGLTYAHLPYKLALVPALTIVPVVSFLVSKVWAFQRPFNGANPA